MDLFTFGNRLATLTALRPTQPTAVVLLVGLLLLLLLLLLLVPSRARRAVAHLPRPRTALPFVGDTFTLFSSHHRRTMHTWLYHECLRLQSQPFVVDILSKPPMVVLSTVHAMEDVLKREADAFVKGADFTAALGDLFGRGIFVTDGTAWHAQRKTANLLVAPHALRGLMDAVMVTKTETLCALVADVARRGTTLDAKHVLELFASDVFATIGFGIDLDFMGHDESEFFTRFNRANHHTLARQQQPTRLWQLTRLLNVGAEKQHRDDVAWLDRFVYRLIEDSIARKQQSAFVTGTATASVAGPRHDIVSLFLDGHAGEYSVADVRDMAMAFISAGRDTTASSMTWFLIMMAQHPDVQHKIRAELRATLPQLFTGERRVPDKELTSELVYLEAAIRENLRLHTVIPLNTRETARDVTLRDGTFLAAGTQVLLPAYAMARLPWIWGDDATQFKPERWLDGTTGKLIHVSPFQFVTFSAGPRVCPGKQFSIWEMKIALAALLSQFEITTEKDPRTFTYDTALALGVEGPVFIRPTLVSCPQ